MYLNGSWPSNDIVVRQCRIRARQNDISQAIERSVAFWCRGYRGVETAVVGETDGPTGTC